MRSLRALAVPCALTVAATCADSPVALERPSDGLDAAETADAAGTIAAAAAESPPATLVKLPVFVRSFRWEDKDSARVVAGDHNLWFYHSNATMFTHDRMALWRRTIVHGAPADTASRERPTNGKDGVWFKPFLPWFGLWWRHQMVHIDFQHTDMMHPAAGWHSMSEGAQVDTMAIGFHAPYYREEPRQFVIKLRRDGLWTEKVKLWTPIDSVKADPIYGYVGTSWCRFSPVHEKTNADGVTWETDRSCRQEPWEEADTAGSG